MAHCAVLWFYRINYSSSWLVFIMTPTRLRECLETLDWTQRGFARLINWSEGTVRQWARGAMPIPQEIADWLEKLMEFLKEHPVPSRCKD